MRLMYIKTAKGITTKIMDKKLIFILFLRLINKRNLWVNIKATVKKRNNMASINKG